MRMGHCSTHFTIQDWLTSTTISNTLRYTPRTMFVSGQFRGETLIKESLSFNHTNNFKTTMALSV